MVHLPILFVLLVAADPHPGAGAGFPFFYNEWQSLASLPGPRASHMAAAGPDTTDLRCFVFGGAAYPGADMDRICLGYSAREDRWFELSSMPTARGRGQAVTLNGLVHVLGGIGKHGNRLSVVETYDPVIDTWTRSQPLPENLDDFGAVAWRDSIIYVIGGGNWLPGSPPSNRVWFLDSGSGEWRAATPLPAPLGASCCGITGDTILVATGWTSGGPTSRAWRGTIQPGRPDLISWQELDPLPGEPRSRSAGAAVQGLLVVSGGTLPDHTVTAQTWILDPESGSWHRLADKTTPVSDVCEAAALGSRLLVAGGFAGSAPYTKLHQALDLGQFVHDVGIQKVMSPLGRLRPDSVYSASAVVVNNGSEPDRPFVSFWLIDSATRRLVFARDTTLDLDPGQKDTVLFGSFDPDQGRIYEIRVLTHLPADENRLNDTLFGRCRTTSGSEPDGYGYVYLSTQEPDSVNFQWHNPVNSDTVRSWFPDPDDGTSRRNLPFPFVFYGDTLSSINVCTNGFLSASPAIAHANRSMPLPDLTHLIAPFWDDLTLREQGTVLEKRYPDRIIYSWVDVPRYDEPGSALTFQAILYRSGNIQFNYLEMNGSRASSTVGIQGLAGTWDWYTEYLVDGIPNNHVVDDSVSIFFRSPDAGIAGPGAAAPGPIRLQAPSVVSGRTLPVILTWAGEPPQVRVFDASGTLVAAFEPGTGSPWSARWDMLDRHGRRLPAGSYFLRAGNESGTAARRLLMVR